jgi:hypothetical protein
LGGKISSGLLNLSTSASDNSFLEPDDYASGEQIEVTVLTIDEIAKRYLLSPLSPFLKIEAEGFELEIV